MAAVIRCQMEPMVSFEADEIRNKKVDVLPDVMAGDATLFMRADQVEGSWSVITPVLNTWQNNYLLVLEK